MADNASDTGCSTSPDLTIETLDQVNTTAKELPSPTLITDTVLPEEGAVKGRDAVGSVTDETTNGVSVHSQHEGDEQVVSVPERLEGLLANSVVRSCVHEKHAEKHNVARNATGLGVVDLDGEHWSDLGSLDVEEATGSLALGAEGVRKGVHGGED